MRIEILDNHVPGGRICLICHGFWPDSSALCPGCLEAMKMPKGTKVDRCYQKLKDSKGKGSAAAICQSSTGQSLKTGKPPKRK